MQTENLRISGQIVDVLQRRIFSGTLVIHAGKIERIVPEETESDRFILPGLVDAHIHVESSMLVPSEFARLAVAHGTVAVVSDPHEIANVLGIEGIRYMIENGKTVPLKIFFGAPSCVPATGFESSGAVIDASRIRELLTRDQLKYLSEMMNYPGVIAADPEVMAKLRVALEVGSPIDGHAPGLSGPSLKQYIQAGISTDHEAFRLAEGEEKIAAGMKILIREGSAARNFEALHPLIEKHPEHCMFCCDDKHPNDLVIGHINPIVRLALQKGYDIFNILQCACVNAVRFYGLEVGLLQPGDPADFIVVDDLRRFNVRETYIDGQLVARDGKCLFDRGYTDVINHFETGMKRPADFAVPIKPGRLRVIEVIEGELVTREVRLEPKIVAGNAVADPERDILKVAVINRYQDAPPAVGFIRNVGLKEGALASSVAHDSHNIVAIGANDRDLARAVNLVIAHRGGLALADGDQELILPLPVAGLMSVKSGQAVAEDYRELMIHARKLGVKLQDPYMTMAFMALLVIPELKISDKGLFDAKRFEFTGLFAE